jgi:predicted protein tyrosine phosphatase
LKVLFLCSQNRFRSLTAEKVFEDISGLEVDSAGLNHDARVPLSAEQLEWADIVFVMENAHVNKLAKRFKPHLKNKRVVCLNIPDEFEYMQAELVDILTRRVSGHLGLGR